MANNCWVVFKHLSVHYWTTSCRIVKLTHSLFDNPAEMQTSKNANMNFVVVCQYGGCMWMIRAARSANPELQEPFKKQMQWLKGFSLILILVFGGFVWFWFCFCCYICSLFSELEPSFSTFWTFVFIHKGNFKSSSGLHFWHLTPQIAPIRQEQRSEVRWQQSPPFTTNLNHINWVIFHPGILWRNKILYARLPPHS